MRQGAVNAVFKRVAAAVECAEMHQNVSISTKVCHKFATRVGPRERRPAPDTSTAALETVTDRITPTRPLSLRQRIPSRGRNGVGFIEPSIACSRVLPV